MSRSSFWRGRKVLITGAAGYLAGLLSRRLSEQGAEVVGADRASPGPSFSGRTMAVDLRGVEAIERLLSEAAPQTLFHLAGQSGVAASEKDPAGAFEANALATWCLLEACRRAPRPPEMIVASSNHVYGHQEGPGATGEEAPLRGAGPYAASKACADIAARCFGQTYGLPVAVARITNTFGGSDPHSGHLVTGTIRSVLAGKAPVIRGNPDSSKGFLYIEDNISALLCLGERIGTLGLKGEAFNFVPDQPTSVAAMVSAVLRAAGRADLRPVLASEAAPLEREHLSNAKAARVLGWRPRYSLDEGLAAAIRDLEGALKTA